VLALHEDLGKQFRHAPVAEQRAELLKFIEGCKTTSDETSRLLASEESPAVRLSFEELIDACDAHVLQAEERMRELGE